MPIGGPELANKETWGSHGHSVWIGAGTETERHTAQQRCPGYLLTLGDKPRLLLASVSIALLGRVPHTGSPRSFAIGLVMVATLARTDKTFCARAPRLLIHLFQPASSSS